MTTLFLLRHAECEPSDLLPEPDWPLSEVGKRQADERVQKLAPLDLSKIYSSPYRRAISSVEPIARHKSFEINLIDDLRERKVGGFFKDPEEFFATMERLWLAPERSIGAGESGASARDRFCTALALIARENEGERVLISTHGQVLSLFLKTMESSVDHAFWRAMKNPDLFEVKWARGKFHWQRQRSACHRSRS